MCRWMRRSWIWIEIQASGNGFASVIFGEGGCLFATAHALPNRCRVKKLPDVAQVGRWSSSFPARPEPAAEAGVLAAAHLIASYTPRGPYPRREVLAAAAGSVRKAGLRRRAHPLLLQSRPPTPWGLRRHSYLLRRRHLPSRAAAYRRLPLQPWRSWRSPLMRSTYQLSALRSMRTVRCLADGQRATVPRHRSLRCSRLWIGQFRLPRCRLLFRRLSDDGTPRRIG